MEEGKWKGSRSADASRLQLSGDELRVQDNIPRFQGQRVVATMALIFESYCVEKASMVSWNKLSLQATSQPHFSH